jgi:hypothetical protein
LPAIAAALWFFRDRPLGAMGEGVYHALYLLIIFMGFGGFLFVFLFREQRARVKALRRSGIIDGERVTVISVFLIYARLFRFRFLALYIRQCLYLLLFILLLDFSFNVIQPIHQPGGRDTVFSRGGTLSKQAEKAHFQAKLAPGYQRALDELLGRLRLEYDQETHTDQKEYISVRLSHPVWLISPRTREILSESGQRQAGGDLKMSLEIPALSPAQREALYFAVLQDTYISLNRLLLFSLFMLIFVGFDLRILMDEQGG